MNATIERIHKVLGDLVKTYSLYETYIHDPDPWMVILAAAAFVVISIYHHTEDKNPGQLVFGRNMILPINQLVDWKCILQCKQA